MLDLRLPWLPARAVARLVAPLVLAVVVTLLPLAAYAATITVNGTTCTLPDAIMAANTNAVAGGCTAGSGTDTLLLGGLTHSLATGPYDHNGMTATPSVTSTIIISGGVDGAIVERSGAAKYRLFHVGQAGDLTLLHVIVRNGDLNLDNTFPDFPENEGGAIYNRGTVTLLNSQLISNTAYYGGGFYNYGTATLTNTQISFNTVPLYGGGFINYGTVTLTNTEIGSNTAQNLGGGFYNFGTATLTNTQISFNTANNGGGFTNDGTATLTNTQILSNAAQVDGGGFFNFGTATLTNTQIGFNTAQWGGGGFYNEFIGIPNGGMITLTNTQILSNAALLYGGGFYNRGTATLTNTQISSNTAKYGGGFDNIGIATLTNTQIGSNTALLYGGGFTNDGIATLTNTQIGSNTAKNLGGGFINYGTATLTNTQIISNTAHNGGGFYNEYYEFSGIPDSGTITLTNTQILSNAAQVDGGGFYNNGTATLTQARIEGNKASGAGGALDQGSSGATSLAQSCIADNSDTAVVNDSGVTIAAANNWWGASDGPSGAGAGAGDTVSSHVTFVPVLTTAPAGCSSIAAEAAFSKRTSRAGDLLPGQPLTYTLTLTNTGAQKSKALYITDALPTGFDLLTTNTTGPAVNINGSRYVITELMPSQVATIHLVGQVDDTLNANMVLNNTATFTNSLIGAIPSSVSNNVVVPVLAWSQEEYAAAEEGGDFTATLNLSPPNPYATVTVQVEIIDSAQALAVAAVQQVTFPPGSSSQPVVVTVTNDAVVTPRTILLELQSPVGASLGAGSSANATITLVEDDAAPGIAISIRASSAQAQVGDTITYTYRITNTGNATLTTVSAEDDKLGIVAGLAGQLAPNATRSASLTYVVTASDLPGPLVNTVVATATDLFATVVTDEASVSVALPAIAIHLQANTTQATVGDTITYTYRITNTGNVTLTTVSAEDDKLGIVAGLAGQLAPNATRSASLTYVVTASDLPGPLVNTAVATATDSQDTEVAGSASASVTLVSSQDGQDALYLPRLHR